MTGCIIVFTTTNKEKEAVKLAKLLVGDRLAAGVNIIEKVRSFYEWHGEICDEKEFILMIKTSAERFEEIRDLIRKHHSYELPEIIALEIKDGLPDYLKWIENAVSK